MSNQTQDQIFLLYLNDVRTKLIYYECITVIPVGIALNILSSIVFMRKKFSKITMGYYNIVISMVNILSSIFGTLNYIGQAIGKDLTLISDFSCIFLTFGMRIFAQMSSWMNVFVTVDRMVTITYPNKYPFLKNKKKLSFMILTQFLIICIINVTNLLLKVETIVTLNPATNKTITTKACTSTNEAIITIRDIIVLLFRAALPIILMISMNIYLMIKLVRERVKLKRLNELRKEYQFAISIFFMNALYTLFLLPGFVIIIYLNAIQSYKNLNIEVAVLQFAYVIALLIASCEFFFTFFVNILFNKIFKKELIVFLNEIFSFIFQLNK